MITGDSPFKAKNYQLILEENKRCNIDFAKPVWNEISFECKTLLKKMCEVKPDQRASSLDILESPWIVHNTKQSSEITYYQSFSKGVSGLEYGDKGGRSVKSVKKGNNSDSEKSSSNNDFQNDFSYYSNELKSFYKKNSMKTIHSQKSNISNISNSIFVFQNSD
jgi:serine/threonine protein kinase